MKDASCMDFREQERQVWIYAGVGDYDVDLIVPSATQAYRALLILHNSLQISLSVSSLSLSLLC